MTRYIRSYRDFSGGLSEIANDNMPDNALVKAQNVVSGEGAGIERASGYTTAFPKKIAQTPSGSFLLDIEGQYDEDAYAGDQISSANRYFVTINGQVTDTVGVDVPDGGTEVIGFIGGDSVSIFTDGNILTISAPGHGGETLTITVERIVPLQVGGDNTTADVLAVIDVEFSVIVDGEETAQTQTLAFSEDGLYKFVDGVNPSWDMVEHDVFTYTTSSTANAGDYYITIDNAKYGFTLDASLASGSTVVFDALTETLTINGTATDCSLGEWSGATELSATKAESTAASWGSGLALAGWFVYGKVLYWITGEGYYKYDGTTASIVVPQSGSNDPLDAAQIVTWEEYIKTADFVAQRGTRWFFSGKDTDSVLFTETGRPDVFLPASVLNVLSQESDHITGLCEFNTGLLIFKERSVHFLTGWDLNGGTDIQMQRINVTSGTKFGNTICPVDNAVLYLGYDGVYRLYVPNYTATSVVASRNLSELKTSKLFYEFDPTDAFATEYRGVYYLHIDNGMESVEYRYNLAEGSFWGPFTQQISCYSSSLEQNALFIGCKNGVILRQDESVYHYVATENSNGYSIGDELPIEVYAETKGFDLTGGFIRNMKLKKVHIVAKQFRLESSNIVVRVKTDYTDTQFAIDFDESLIYGEGIYGDDYWGWKETVTKQFNVNRKAKRMKLFFFTDSLDEPVLIYGIGCIYKLKKPKSSREGVVAVPVDYDD